RLELLRHVYVPAAASWIPSSLRTSVGFAVVGAVIGAVIGEYLGASAGLGYLISQAQGNFNPTGVFAGIVILAAFVLLIDVVLDFVEKRLITWRPKVQQTQTT
nr:ABC transporter permease subunit [Allgaiera sp.]